jgi:sarcosine oxidase subunit alpha
MRRFGNASGAWIRSKRWEGAERADIDVDGRIVTLFAGECLATALATAGIVVMGASPGGRPRGAYCMMGVCQQCVARVNGVLQRTCMVEVRAGLTVQTGLATPGGAE